MRVEEVYTIKQVAEITGVPSNTIRSWERRFGVPVPDRSGSNQRRYSEADIKVIRALQASRSTGRTMDQAIQDLGALEPEMRQVVGAPVPAPGNDLVADSAPAPGQRLLDALRTYREQDADAILGDSAWISSIEESCLELLLPTEVLLHREMAEGRISPAQGQYCQEWISRKLASAFDASNPPIGRSSLLIVAVHDSSARTLSLCFAIALSRAGHRVHWIGDGVSGREIHELVAGLDPAGILLVASSELAARSVSATAGGLNPRGRQNGWHGAILTAGVEPVRGAAIPFVPSNTRIAVEMVDEALQAQPPGLQLMRNE